MEKPENIDSTIEEKYSEDLGTDTRETVGDEKSDPVDNTGSTDQEGEESSDGGSSEPTRGTKAPPKYVRFKKGNARYVSNTDTNTMSVTYPDGSAESYDSIYLGNKLIGTSRVANLSANGLTYINPGEFDIGREISDNRANGLIFFDGAKLLKLLCYTSTTGGETVTDGYVLRYSETTGYPYWSEDKTKNVPVSGTNTRRPILLKNTNTLTQVTDSVVFSNARDSQNSSISVLSATTNGDLYSSTLNASGNITSGATVTASYFKVSGTTTPSQSYIKADGSGTGGVFTPATQASGGVSAQDGLEGLVPAPPASTAGSTDKYLRSDGVWATPSGGGGGGGTDELVLQTSTSGVTRYPLLFRNVAGTGSSATADTTRYSGATSGTDPYLSATGDGDLYARSLNIKGNAANPTNEIVLENYRTANTSAGGAGNETPAIRFQRCLAGDGWLDWLLRNGENGEFTISSQYSSTVSSVLELRNYSTSTYAKFGTGINVISQNHFYLDSVSSAPLCEWETF